MLRNVKYGSTVYTDDAVGYESLGYRFVHDVVNHAETYVRGRAHTNSLENSWSLLKRTLRGTYVAVEPFHLDRYVDEQVFRFNNRKDKNDSDRFALAMSQIAGKRITYSVLDGQGYRLAPHVGDKDGGSGSPLLVLGGVDIFAYSSGLAGLLLFSRDRRLGNLEQCFHPPLKVLKYFRTLCVFRFHVLSLFLVKVLAPCQIIQQQRSSHRPTKTVSVPRFASSSSRSTTGQNGNKFRWRLQKSHSIHGMVRC